MPDCDIVMYAYFLFLSYEDNKNKRNESRDNKFCGKASMQYITQL